MYNKLPNYTKVAAKKIYLVHKNVWDANGWNNSAGKTFMYAKPYVYVPCDGGFTYADAVSNYAIYHELGHAVDARYYGLTFDSEISSQPKYVDLKNKAFDYSKKNSNCYIADENHSSNSGKCSILRGYAYKNQHEFFAESFMMTIRTVAGYSQSDGISRVWGPTNVQTFSPYGTIDAEMKKTLEEVKKVIKQ